MEKRPDPIPAIHRRIRNRRESQGLAAYELARRARISPSYLSLIEKGVKVPSREIAERLARELGDDPELYRAWIHAARNPDYGDDMLRMQRLARLRESPELRRRLRQGQALDFSSEAEEAAPESAHSDAPLADTPPDAPAGEGGRTRRASERARSWAARAASAVGGALSRREPHTVSTTGTTLSVPLLPDGADPADAAGLADAESEMLELDRRMLPPSAGAAEGWFAYRPGPAAVERVRGQIGPDDLVVFVRSFEALDPNALYLVRYRNRTVLARVARHGDVLFLLSSDSAESPATLHVPDDQALRQVIVGVVLTTIRSWARAPADAGATPSSRESLGRSVRLEGDWLVRDCEWRDRYGWRPLQRPEDLDYLEANPGSRIRFRLLEDGVPRFHLEMSPAEWRAALGDYAEGRTWRTNGYIVAVTRRVSGEYTREFQDRWAPYVKPVAG